MKFYHANAVDDGMGDFNAYYERRKDNMLIWRIMKPRVHTHLRLLLIKGLSW